MTKISKRKWIQRKQVHHWNKNPTYNPTSSLQHPSFAYENVTLKIYLPTKIIFVTIKYKTKRRCFKRDYMIFFFNGILAFLIGSWLFDLMGLKHLCALHAGRECQIGDKSVNDVSVSLMGHDELEDDAWMPTHALT